MKHIPANMKEQLRDLKKLLKNAEKTLAEDKEVDIVTLDEKMANICHNMEDMTEEAQDETAPIVNNLSSNLMEISIAMKQQ